MFKDLQEEDVNDGFFLSPIAQGAAKDNGEALACLAG